jgi:hypothetical protein
MFVRWEPRLLSQRKKLFLSSKIFSILNNRYDSNMGLFVVLLPFVVISGSAIRQLGRSVGGIN